MINVNELIYEVELGLKKVSTFDSVNIEKEDILIYLNRAQLEWIKTKLNSNNVSQTGYEETRKRIEDLQILKNPSPFEIPLIKNTNIRYISYVGDISIIKDYMFYVESYVSAKHKKCEGVLDVDLIREGELNVKYFSEHFKPSFEWRSTIATKAGNNLVIYSADNMILNKLYLTYLRYPKKIDISGYIKLDGSESIQQDCELPEYAQQDLVDLCIKYISHSFENQFQTQATQIRLNTNE